MARTSSNMIPLGTSLPAFDLSVVADPSSSFFEKTDGLTRISNKDVRDKPVLFMFLSFHCPFVKHIQKGLSSLDKDYGERINMIAISSNSLITHPQDGPENLILQASENGWRFPYLLDPDQSFAKSLKAACTPDFFLFSNLENEQQNLLYRGQLDGSRPGNEIPVTGNDLRAALNAVLEGTAVPSPQKPSIGCNIKWHPGKEPAWFG